MTIFTVNQRFVERANTTFYITVDVNINGDKEFNVPRNKHERTPLSSTRMNSRRLNVIEPILFALQLNHDPTVETHRRPKTPCGAGVN